jgi:exopolyphosphatase/guanosine-5'-triphosphate,3'-diphosphate pyrophosphatase
MRPTTPVIDDVRGASIAGLARANGVDELAAEPITAVAAVLFEATAAVHGYGNYERDLLLSAARLAGIGMHVDYYNRDRHAEYLVHSGDLRGFDHREIVLLAALARWSFSGTPDLSAYKGITASDDLRRAHVLAVLLGLARAIRRRAPSPLLDVRAELRDDTLRLQLRAWGSLDAEWHEIESQQKRLESVLRLGLALDAGPG